MYKQFFTALESTALPMAAMAFFVISFVVIIVRTFRLKHTSDYDALANMPLEDTPASPSNPEPRAPLASRGDA